jgi:CRP-like cAMP-binding protein
MSELPEKDIREPTADSAATIGEAVVRSSAVVASGHEFAADVQSPNEQIAQEVCRDVLQEIPGYQATFSFGTPGGNDLDLRLCFADLTIVRQDDIREQLVEQLRLGGVDVEAELLFMSADEFVNGIRDLVELGDVSERLRDGFDPHEGQTAVGDTSMFSLYIFSTMRMLHRSQEACSFGSPDEALDRLTLTRDGAVGWMHFYTGAFLHAYLHRLGGNGDKMAPYQERLAKFTARVACGNTLARVEPESKLNMTFKPEFIKAIRRSDAQHSTDAEMTNALLQNPDSFVLLDAESQAILQIASEIRNGNITGVELDFISAAEAELFYRAFEQGIDKRPEAAENADPLTSYALGELTRDLGHVEYYEPGAKLMVQGAPGKEVIYLPLKTQSGRDNAVVNVTVSRVDGNIAAEYARTPGRVVGEAAIFGLPRSATVTAQKRLEAYVIGADTIQKLLADDELHQQLQQPTLRTRDARRLDVLLRYFAREAAIFTRQTLPYTSLGSREDAQELLGRNPLARYNLDYSFHSVLQHCAWSEAYLQVVSVRAENGDPRVLFEAGHSNNQLYVVSEGLVQIPLQNGEAITLQPGEYFGESSLLNMTTTGSAILNAGGVVLAVDAQWFKRFTQSRQIIQGLELPEALRDVLPVHLLYHLAAEGYERVRRRLITQ